MSHGNTVCHMVIQLSHGYTVCHMVIQWRERYLVKVLQNFKWFDDKNKITDGYIFADKILSFRFIRLKEFVCCEVVIKILFRLLFRNHLSLEIGEVLYLKKTWIIFTQECVVQSFLGFFSVIISPLKRAGPFIWMNMSPFHQRMLCTKFGWNRPSGFWEEHF